jgi:nicotinamidase-related amidase
MREALSEQAPETLRTIRGARRPPLDPANAALVIIDAQCEYVDGQLPLNGIEAAIAEIAALCRCVQESGVPIIHIRQIGPSDAKVFAKGSPGAAIVPELTPESNELVIEKVYPNAFNGTRLEAELRRLGRRQLILTGFMAHMCLDSTARAAVDRDYEVFVVASATAERTIPDACGRNIPAAIILRATLAALNDRFAWIIPDAAALACSLP